MAEKAIQLSEAVSKAYKLAPGAAIKTYSRKYGTVDLSTITLAGAKALVAKGYPGLMATGKADAPEVTGKPDAPEAK